VSSRTRVTLRPVEAARRREAKLNPSALPSRGAARPRREFRGATQCWQPVEMAYTEALPVTTEAGGESPLRAEPIRVTMDRRPNQPVLFANYVEATYSGSVFVLSLGQVILPPIRTEEDRKRIAELTEITATEVVQVAIPIREFVEAVGNISTLFERLRSQGIDLPRPTEATP
jgi:hypothetical protein